MDILQSAKALQSSLSQWRQVLHRCPEIGFDLPQTTREICTILQSLGIAPHKIGKGGIVGEIGKQDGPVTLIRADMDALGLREEAKVPFRSENGNMHACGHDLHSAMLLGVAALLKEREQQIQRKIRLYFQPAEEILQGAEDGVSAGVCDGVDRAYMLHVTVNTGLPVGTVIVPPKGIIAPCADYFEILISGKGCHGADPAAGIDPLSVASQLFQGLQYLPAREFPSTERAALTVGTLQGGDSFNVIPDKALLRGSLRCYGEDFRTTLKRRVEEISHLTAHALRASAEVSFPVGCPPLKNDGRLRDDCLQPLRTALGTESVIAIDTPSGTAGSEDFAVISHRVPSVMLALAAGDPKVGLHHPQVIFEESVLPFGTAALTALALE